jgi:hypothetical protein
MSIGLRGNRVTLTVVPSHDAGGMQEVHRPQHMIRPLPDRRLRDLGRLTAHLLAGPLARSGDEMSLHVHVLSDAVRVDVEARGPYLPPGDLRARRVAMRRSSRALMESLDAIRSTADRWEWEPGPPARVSFELDRVAPQSTAERALTCR